MWSRTLALSLAFICGNVVFAAGDQSSAECSEVLTKTTTFTGTCTSTWAVFKTILRPTQAEVGYSWIIRKATKNFSKSKDAQKEIDASPAPVVIGPDNVFYLVDDHHTLCALDYSGFSSTVVTVNVLCDRRGVPTDQFWAEMKEKKLVYLGSHPTGGPNSLPVTITADQLPQFYSFTEASRSFTNDPWRSLAAYSRKVTAAPAPAPTCGSADSKYCERAMYRGCQDGTKATGDAVYYFEFRWGYFMNDATFFNTKYWPSESLRDAFYKDYSVLPVYNTTSPLTDVDTDAWQSAADQLVALCRASSTGEYPLPAELFPDFNGRLPGFVDGYTKLTDDPDCNAPTC